MPPRNTNPRATGRPWDQAAWAHGVESEGRPGAPPEKAGPPDKSIQLFPWWERPLPGSQDYDVIEPSTALGAGPGVIIKPANAQILVPQGYLAVVRFFTLFVDAPTTTIDVDWILLVNDAPVPGWDRMKSFKRNATNLSITKDGWVKVSGGSLISAGIRNNEATARTVGAEIGGWMTPGAAIEQWLGPGQQQ